MGGIINHFHGEGGRAAGRAWVDDGEQLTHRLGLAGDPHRRSAYDHGTDIGIDPAIQDGDEVVYLRLDQTCGIWTKPQAASSPDLPAAVARVRRFRRFMDDHARTGEGRATPPPAWSQHLEEATGLRLAGPDRGSVAAPRDDRPATEASIFVSYASRNVLLARQIDNDLRSDTKANVWFDLAQPGEAPRHLETVAEWLRQAVYRSRGLVVLLTHAALESPWVRREVEWATEQARRDAGFRLIVLKLADVALPLRARSAAVIDCRGLWRSNGINEELYAALFQRQGRRAWLERLAGAGGVARRDANPFGYDDFASDSGTAVSFGWRARRRGLFKPGRELAWRLSYERGGRVLSVAGTGDDQPVDLSIKAGDRIGRFICRHRWGTHLPEGVPLWMRADDLGVSPDAVLDAYYEASGADEQALAKGPELVVSGEDAYGRTVADMRFRTEDGRTISYPKLMRMTFTKRRMTPPIR